jgi:hypothetical protein
MDSNHRSLARKSRFLLRKANYGDQRGSQKGLFLTRYRWFESISLQRRVSDEPSRRLSIRTADMTPSRCFRLGYSGQIFLKPSFPGRLEPTAGSVSPILSKRSARSNSSSWISAIVVCRANCRTFSAIARQCRAVLLPSSLNDCPPDRSGHV